MGGRRFVFDAPGNREYGSGGESYSILASAVIAQCDDHIPVQNVEELVGVDVTVPDELAPDFDDPNVVVVDPGHDMGAPFRGERVQRLLQADRCRCHRFMMLSIEPQW